jgi:hypothetical protein
LRRSDVDANDAAALSRKSASERTGTRSEIDDLLSRFSNRQRGQTSEERVGKANAVLRVVFRSGPKSGGKEEQERRPPGVALAENLTHHSPLPESVGRHV